MTQAIIAPSVSLVNGRPATNSLKIAEHFGKRHDNIVRDIRRILIETPEDFNRLNFEEVKYTDAKGEKRDAYDVFFDGFILLAMGYTGKQALKIKLVYIAAFNAMRERLSGITHPLPSPRTLPALATPEERKPLDKLVKVWASLLGGDSGVYARIWTQVDAHLGLLKIEHATPAQVKKGISFVQGRIDELQRALPTPAYYSAHDALRAYMEKCAAIRNDFEWLRHELDDALRPLLAVKSAQEKAFLGNMRGILNKYAVGIGADMLLFDDMLRAAMDGAAPIHYAAAHRQ